MARLAQAFPPLLHPFGPGCLGTKEEEAFILGRCLWTSQLTAGLDIMVSEHV